MARLFRVSVICLVTLMSFCSLTVAERAKLPDGFVLESLLSGLDRPSAMVIADDGTAYIAERFTGKVLALRQGKLQVTPVVTVNVSTDGEEGLLDLAFARDGHQGYLFLFYTEQGTHANKVVRYNVNGGQADSPLTIIDLGASSGNDRLGGGLVVDEDGFLFVSAGDLGTGSSAQDDESNLGKVLRLNADGSIPADNPDPTSPVFAKGFRDGAGMTVHRGVNSLYQSDRGPSGGNDELNAVAASGNYGWDLHTGPGGGGGYTDPLDSRSPLVGPTRPGAYVSGLFPDGSADSTDNDLDGLVDERDENYGDSVFYGCAEDGNIIRSVLTGADLDVQDSAQLFFDADVEFDGTPDTGCPPVWADLDAGDEGLLYGLGDDAVGGLDGLYRFTHPQPGAREVSPTGSLFPMGVEKSGSDLTLFWESTGRDAWVGTTTGATQPVEKYTLWEGTLPITAGSYSHAVKSTTDGSAVNDGLRSATITPNSSEDNTYYLVSAQADNLEGTLGTNTAATPLERPGKGIDDYCNEIGWFDNEAGDANKETECNGIDDDGDGSIDESCPGRCGPDFVDPGGQPARLLDQYGNYWTLHDFRGGVLHLDISALDCVYCKEQAPEFRDLHHELRGRGFVSITALMNTYGAHDAIPPENCAEKLQYWIDTYAPGGDDLILCAVDDDADGIADIWEQYGDHLYQWLGMFWQRCGGTPTNFYFDQGMVNYQVFCGKTSKEDSRATIVEKLPAESCE